MGVGGGSQLAVEEWGEFIIQAPDLSFIMGFFQFRFITPCVLMPVTFQAKIAVVIYFRGSGRQALPDSL